MLNKGGLILKNIFSKLTVLFLSLGAISSCKTVDTSSTVTRKQLGACADLYTEVTQKEVVQQTNQVKKLQATKPADFDIFTTENVVSDNLGDYYTEFDFTVSDKQTLINNVYRASKKNQKSSTYDLLKTTLPQIDFDPRNPDNVILFYTGESREYPGNMSGSINREHMWPNSRGAGKTGPGADPLMLRPCDVSVNSARGNMAYGENKSNAFDPGYSTKWEFKEEFRGIAARATLYTGLRYGKIANDPKGFILTNSVTESENAMGVLDDLVKWNLEYPVTFYEMHRNDRGMEVAGNRNPFTDFPSLVCDIWGDFSDNTRQYCQNGVTTDPEDKPDGSGSGDSSSSGSSSTEVPSQPETPDGMEIKFDDKYQNMQITAGDKFIFDRPIITNGTNNENLIYFSKGEYAEVDFHKGEVSSKKQGTEKIYVCDTNTGVNTSVDIVIAANADQHPDSSTGSGDSTSVSPSPVEYVDIRVQDLNSLDELKTGSGSSAGIDFSFVDLRNFNDGTWFLDKNGGHVYNTTPTPYYIDKIELSVPSSGSKAAKIYVTFGDQMVVQSSSTFELSSLGLHTFTPTTDARYFRIETSDKNLQFVDLKIYFK